MLLLLLFLSVFAAAHCHKPKYLLGLLHINFAIQPKVSQTVDIPENKNKIRRELDHRMNREWYLL